MKSGVNSARYLTATARNAGVDMALPFATGLLSLTSQFKWIGGEENLGRYHSTEYVVKYFCKVCGSNLISTYDNDAGRIGVPLGGLDQAPDNRPEGHIWVGSKSPWFDITDDMPQYESWPGSQDKVRETGL